MLRGVTARFNVLLVRVSVLRGATARFNVLVGAKNETTRGIGEGKQGEMGR